MLVNGMIKYGLSCSSNFWSRRNYLRDENFSPEKSKSSKHEIFSTVFEAGSAHKSTFILVLPFLGLHQSSISPDNGEEWQERTVFVILFQLISEFAFFVFMIQFFAQTKCFGKLVFVWLPNSFVHWAKSLLLIKWFWMLDDVQWLMMQKTKPKLST